MDEIVVRVRERLPDVTVTPWEGAHPNDDDSVWFFCRPGARWTIQLESGLRTGMCPFFVEHDGMPSPAAGGGVTAPTVDEAVRRVVEFFEAEQARGGDPPARP